MKVIKDNVISELIIKKSKFICCLFYIDDDALVSDVLNDLRSKYKDATHYCYAYVISGKEKASDDNEPSKTAGLPMLNVLKKNDLTNVLAVVIRYFGGVKLGAGGLVRAYSKAVKEALDLTQLLDNKKYLYLDITFSYDNLKTIDNIIKDLEVVEKDFSNDIYYKIKIEDTIYPDILDKLKRYIK